MENELSHSYFDKDGQLISTIPVEGGAHELSLQVCDALSTEFIGCINDNLHVPKFNVGVISGLSMFSAQAMVSLIASNNRNPENPLTVSEVCSMVSTYILTTRNVMREGLLAIGFDIGDV